MDHNTTIPDIINPEWAEKLRAAAAENAKKLEEPFVWPVPRYTASAAWLDNFGRFGFRESPRIVETAVAELQRNTEREIEKLFRYTAEKLGVPVSEIVKQYHPELSFDNYRRDASGVTAEYTIKLKRNADND